MSRSVGLIRLPKHNLSFVMPGLVPGIHVFLAADI
jgi:hypothetical protein